MITLLEGVTPFLEKDAQKYNKLRWWPGLTLGDLLDRAADIHPEKEAFVDSRSRITYQEARNFTDRLATGLIEFGINPLDRVLLQLPNWNEFVFSYFALQKIGAIPVLLIDRYRQFEINRLIELTGATATVENQRIRRDLVVEELREAALVGLANQAPDAVELLIVWKRRVLIECLHVGGNVLTILGPLIGNEHQGDVVRYWKNLAASGAHQSIVAAIEIALASGATQQREIGEERSSLLVVRHRHRDRSATSRAGAGSDGPVDQTSFCRRPALSSSAR